MAETGATDLLQWVGKYGRFLAAARITPEGFAAALLDQLAATTNATTQLAAKVVAATPVEARPAMAAVVHRAMQPEFRKPAWHYGGPDNRTDAEREEESAFLTARVRSWAAALAEHLGDVTPG